MSTPRISVIMPVFNAERHVREAIGSLLAQTFSDFELIVIDDGSTDESLQVVQGIGDPRLRLLQNASNLGAAETKNRGIENARAEFIAFLDADDLAFPERLAEQLDYLERNPEISVVATQSNTIDASGNVTGAYTPAVPSDEIPAFLLFGNCIQQSSVMLRRTALGDRRFRTVFEPAEDYDLWTRLAADAKFAIMDRPLIHYRIHEGGISSRKTDAMAAAVRAVARTQLARLGIVPDSAQLKLHTLLACWPLSPQKETLAATEAWLRELRRANEAAQTYPPPVFDRVLGERWFQICCDSWQLGLRAWKAFYTSPLRRLAGTKLSGHYCLLRRTLPQSFRNPGK
jgi:glycosyltransferase involved in cell wall biosynthesis